LTLWKKKIDETFSVNLALKARVKAVSHRGNLDLYSASNVNDGNKETYWATDDAIRKGSVRFTFREKQKIQYIVIQEYIPLGQRVKSFDIEVRQSGRWQQISKGTTIGFKRIIRVAPVETGDLRINITDSKACPVISNIELY
jgi:alpha-L-fucosidase